MALLGAVALIVAAAAGCSSSSHGASGSTTIASTVVAGPVTSAQPVPPATPISIPTATDGASPDGSGCDPPTGDSLPDGLWFGVLRSVDPAAGTVGLDLACRFSGTAAQAASGSSGPVPNDVYVRNQSTKVYVVKAVDKVAVVPLAQAPGGGFTGANGPTATGLAAAQAIATDASNHQVWIEITDGQATVIQAQFSP